MLKGTCRVSLVVFFYVTHCTGSCCGAALLLCCAKTGASRCKIKKMTLNVQTSWCWPADTDTSGVTASAHAAIFRSKLLSARVLRPGEEDGWLCSSSLQLLSPTSAHIHEQLRPPSSAIPGKSDLKRNAAAFRTISWIEARAVAQ